MIFNVTNGTGEYIKKVTYVDIVVTITTCSLSIIGAVIIFINIGRKFYRAEQISDLMKLLFYLTIFTAIGYLFGAVRFLYGDDISPEKVLACHVENDFGCTAQSFMTTMSSGITITALAKRILGSDISVGSGTWCWISACLSDNERTIWMAVSGKGWEILMYFSCLWFYMLLKYRQKCEMIRSRRVIHNIALENI
ncbi:GPR157 [Mytilus coruscus]|uniref:GPR157 n=1 Tax=Mytilus coruscus TaxID=42192 RepID=A0A6J8AC32_MYTCO|nr:GPR157 [Mytilus coruscus]